jgi:hypothetical protein
VSTSLIGTPSVGAILNGIERIASEVRRIESESVGHYIAGRAGDDLKELAKRLENLTKPNKGFLPGPARELRDAA